MPRAILSANPYEEMHLSVSLLDRPSEETLAVAQARGGPDNSALTVRGIRGLFYEQSEIGAAQIWALAAGLMFASDSLTEKHRWLGQVPEPRKHFGGLNLTKLRDLGMVSDRGCGTLKIWTLTQKGHNVLSNPVVRRFMSVAA